MAIFNSKLLVYQRVSYEYLMIGGEDVRDCEGLGGFGNGRPKNQLLKDCFQMFPTSKADQTPKSSNWMQLGHLVMKKSNNYPLVMTNIAIENGHRNSEFSH